MCAQNMGKVRLLCRRHGRAVDSKANLVFVLGFRFR